MHCKEQLHGCIAAALSAPDNTPSVLQEHALVKKKKILLIKCVSVIRYFEIK